MTKKQRVIATIKGEETDYLPFHSDMTSVVREKLAEYYKIGIKDVYNKIDNHITYCSYKTFAYHKVLENKIKLDKELSIDEFGILWDSKSQKNIGDWGMVDHPVRNFDFSNYVWPNGEEPGRFDDIEQQVMHDTDNFITLGLSGLFDTAWHLTGIEDMLMAMADSDTSVINYVLDHSLNFLVGVIRQIPKGAIDSVRFVEDWGSQHGLIMGIQNWRKYLKPRLKELYAEVHEKGLFVHSHSCGDNSELYGDLIEIKVNISDPLQPEVMDIGKVKERFGHDITFMGGLPCQSIIPMGSPNEVYDITKKTYEVLAKGGHYILGGAGAFSTETPVDNIIAIVNFYNEIKQSV